MPITRRAPVAGLAALSAIAVAAQAAGPASEEELEEVIVLARSLEVTTPLELSKYGYDVEFVSGKQIRDHGFVDLPQALEMLVPGAYVAPQAGAFSYINLSLQGSRNGDALWTVDGVRINNRLYNTTSPTDTLPASMVERLEVMKGGHGLLYGTQAVAGVLNTVTRAFSDAPDGAVSLGTDSRDGVHANAYFRDTIGRQRFVAWASKDRTDGFSPYDAYQPGATTRTRHYDIASFGLKYGLEFTDNLRLTLQGTHTEGDVDFATHTSTDVNRRNEEILSARLDYTSGGRVDLFLKGYLHDWDTNYFPVADPADRAYWGFRDVGLSAATRFNLHRGLDYHLGYEFQSYRGRDDYLLIEEKSEKAHAVYAQLRTTDDLSSRARLTGGLRYTDTGGVGDMVWSTSGVYDITDALYVESSLGTSFRLPDAYQLYAIDPFDTRGHPDLEPEESFNVNLAVGGRLQAGARTLAWQLTGWKRQVKNLIVSDESNPPDGFDAAFVNIDGKVKVSGFEALLRGPLAGMLSFDASYMFSRERDPATGSQLADRPRHSGKLALQLAPADGRWGTNLALKFMGSTHATAAGFGRVSYGDVVVANLGAHVFLDAEQRHRFGLRVENVLDKEYATRVRSAVLAGSDPEDPERFIYRNRGTPRTLYLNYSLGF